MAKPQSLKAELLIILDDFDSEIEVLLDDGSLTHAQALEETARLQQEVAGSIISAIEERLPEQKNSQPIRGMLSVVEPDLFAEGYNSALSEVKQILKGER